MVAGDAGLEAEHAARAAVATDKGGVGIGRMRRVARQVDRGRNYGGVDHRALLEQVALDLKLAVDDAEKLGVQPALDQGGAEPAQRAVIGVL